MLLLQFPWLCLFEHIPKEKPERFFTIQDLLLGVIMLFCGTAVLSAQWVDQWLDEETAPGKMRVHARLLLLCSTLQKTFLQQHFVNCLSVQMLARTL